VVGVVDRTGEIKVVTGDLDGLKSRLTLMIRDKIFPELRTRIENCEVNGRRLVAIIVEEGDSGPYGVGSDRRNLRYYVRRGATTPPASQDEIRAAARKGSTASDTTYADF
jgi:predicted HTH transcriptional regulator